MCVRRAILGELILNYLAQITLPKSVANYLGSVFIPDGNSWGPHPHGFWEVGFEVGLSSTENLLPDLPETYFGATF